MSERKRKGPIRWRLWAVVAVIVAVVGAGGLWGVNELWQHQKGKQAKLHLAAAREATAEDDFAAAAINYRAYVEKFPEDTQVLGEYGEVLLKLMAEAEGTDLSRLWSKAADAYEQLARILPDEAKQSKVDALEELAALYISVGRFDDVLYNVDRWLSLEPDSVKARVLRADALIADDKAGDAIKDLEKYVDKFPGEAEFYTRLIRLRVGPERDLDRAKYWVEKALEACPDSWSVHLAAYFHAKAIEEEADAQRYLDEALRMAPDDVRVLVTATQHALLQSDFAKAKTYLDRARPAASDSRGDRRLVLMAEAQWARGQPEKVEQVRVAEALRAEARNASVPLLSLAAELYVQAGEFEKADACIERLDTLPAAKKRLPTIRGARQLAAGNATEAVELLEEGLANEPTNGTAAFLLGLAHLQTGSPTAALAAFRQASVLGPKAIEPRLHVARLAASSGEYSEARTQVMAILRLNPDHAEAMRLEMRLDLQDLSADTARDAEALAGLQGRLAAALEADPEDPELIGLSAAAHLLGGQKDQAEDLRESKRSVPALAESMSLGLAELYVRDGKTDEALELLRETWKQHPASAAVGGRLVGLLVREDHLDEATKKVEAVEDTDLRARLWQTFGMAANRADKTDAAVKAFEHAAALLPKDVPTRQWLLRFKSVTDDRDRADELVKEIGEIEGEDGQIAKVERARLLLMRKEQEPKGVAEAIQILETAAAKRPTWSLPTLMLAQIHDEKGDTLAAIDRYAQALSQDPELADGPLAVRYAILLKRERRFEEADAVMTKVSGRQPDSPAVLLQLAEQKSREGDWNAAADLAAELLEQHPDSAMLAAMTADARLQAKDPQEAVRIAREAAKRAPDAVEPLQVLVAALVAMKDTDQAEREVRSFLQSHEKDAAAHILLGRVLSNSGRMAEADKAYERAALLASDQAPILGAVGAYFGLRGDRERQLEYLRKSIALQGLDPDASPAVAGVLLASTQPADRDAGAQMVEQAMAAAEGAGGDPDPTLLVLSANVLASRPEPDYEEAIARLNQALAKAPRLLDAYRLLGRIHGVRGHLDAAYEVCSRGLKEARSEDPLLLMQRGRVAMAQRQWRAAEADFEEALKVSPQNPMPQGALALAIERGAGEVTEPERRLKRAEDLFVARCEQNPTRSVFLIDRLQFLDRRERYAAVKALTEKLHPEMDDPQAVRFAAASMVVLTKSDAAPKEWGLRVLDGLATAGYRLNNVRVVKGVGLEIQGRIDEAESVLRQVVEAEPDNGGAINALAWVYCEDKNDPQRAFDLLDPYVREHRNQLEALDTYGVVLFRLGKTTESIAVFEECLEKTQPETVVEVAAKFHLGRAMHKDGRIADGKRLMSEARDDKSSEKALSKQERKEAEELLP